MEIQSPFKSSQILKFFTDFCKVMRIKNYTQTQFEAFERKSESLIFLFKL